MPGLRYQDLRSPASRAIVIATGVASLLAAIVSWRASHKAGTPPFVPVLGWQLLVWLPWLAFAPLIEYLGRRVAYSSFPPPIWLGLHLLVSITVSAVHLLWYYRVSDAWSPYHGVAGTKYGVFAYFFIFWFLIDLLLYWTLLAWSHIRDVQAGLGEAAAAHEAPARSSPADDKLERDKVPQHITVRTGRRRRVIQVDDVDWIEAQGYYAALHVGSDAHLLRESLAALCERLDARQFVRIHRSTIANLRFVDAVEPAGSGTWRVRLNDGTLRRLSRAGKQRLKQQLFLN